MADREFEELQQQQQQQQQRQLDLQPALNYKLIFGLFLHTFHRTNQWVENTDRTN